MESKKPLWEEFGYSSAEDLADKIDYEGGLAAFYLKYLGAPEDENTHYPELNELSIAWKKVKKLFEEQECLV